MNGNITTLNNQNEINIDNLKEGKYPHSNIYLDIGVFEILLGKVIDKDLNGETLSIKNQKLNFFMLLLEDKKIMYNFFIEYLFQLLKTGKYKKYIRYYKEKDFTYTVAIENNSGLNHLLGRIGNSAFLKLEVQVSLGKFKDIKEGLLKNAIFNYQNLDEEKIDNAIYTDFFIMTLFGKDKLEQINNKIAKSKNNKDKKDKKDFNSDIYSEMIKLFEQKSKIK